MVRVMIAVYFFCFSVFVYAAEDGKKAAANASKINDATISNSTVNQAGGNIINNYYAPPVSKSLPAKKEKVKTKTKTKKQPVVSAKPVAESAVKTSTTCTIEGDQDVCGNTTGGDTNINFGSSK